MVLTLGELQHIGLESGITPELVAEAAATLDLTQENETPSTLLGLPISVGKTVHIGGTLTEDQWLSLVAQMRIIFSAHGKLEHVSSLRSWRNGNLQISLESGPNGMFFACVPSKGMLNAACGHVGWAVNGDRYFRRSNSWKWGFNALDESLNDNVDGFGRSGRFRNASIQITQMGWTS